MNKSFACEEHIHIYNHIYILLLCAYKLLSFSLQQTESVLSERIRKLADTHIYINIHIYIKNITNNETRIGKKQQSGQRVCQK